MSKNSLLILISLTIKIKSFSINNVAQTIPIYYTTKNNKKMPFINIYFEHQKILALKKISAFLYFNFKNSLFFHNSFQNKDFICEKNYFCEFESLNLKEGSFENHDYTFFNGETSLKLSENSNESCQKINFRYVFFKDFYYLNKSIVGFSPNSDFFKYLLNKNNIFLHFRKEFENDQEIIKFDLKLNESIEDQITMKNDVTKHPIISDSKTNYFKIQGKLNPDFFLTHLKKSYKFCLLFDQNFLISFPISETEKICKFALKKACFNYPNCSEKDEINFNIVPDIKLNFDDSEYLIQSRHYLKYRNQKWECDLKNFTQSEDLINECDFSIGQKFFLLYPPIIESEREGVDFKSFIIFLKFYKNIEIFKISIISFYCFTVLLLLLIFPAFFKYILEMKNKRNEKRNEKIIYFLNIN